MNNMVRNKDMEHQKSDNKDMRDNKIVSLVIIAAGVGLVILGIHNGDYIDILNKAIRICYECIGIG